MHPKAPFSSQSSGHEDSPPPPQTNGQSLTSSLRQFRAEQLSCVFIQHYMSTRSEEFASKKIAVDCTLMLYVTQGFKLALTFIVFPPTLPPWRHTFPRIGSPRWTTCERSKRHHTIQPPFTCVGRISIHLLAVQARTGLNQASTDLIADQTPAEATVVAELSCSDGIYKAT